MKRRLFLGATLSLALAGLSSTVLTGTQHTYYFEVQGPTEKCRDFVIAFQTHLWPEWRTHHDDLGRVAMANCFKSWPPGVGRVYSNDKLCQEALRKTLEQFTVVVL
jgi:hypothetical protein